MRDDNTGGYVEIGIIGQPQSGKSTIFQIMTGINSTEVFGEKFVRGMAKVPDRRFDRLVEIFKPAKVTPASIPFVDVNASGESAWATIRQNLSGVDGILHIVNAFNTTDVGEIVKRYKVLADELILSDLIVVETRLEKLAKLPPKSMKPEEAAHFRILPEAKKLLEDGMPLRELKLSDDDQTALRGFTFWTIRPELVVLNIAEGGEKLVGDFKTQAGGAINVIGINCQIEAEIAGLPPADQKEFLASMGIEMPAFEKIIQTAFSLLGRIYYFTVGEDEVRAWEIASGAAAPRAAAAIHKDFERGFIKAEVIGYDDFIGCGGTLGGAKSAGKYRLEGKEYIVKDGDIINFRFNV